MRVIDWCLMAKRLFLEKRKGPWLYGWRKNYLRKELKLYVRK